MKDNLVVFVGGKNIPSYVENNLEGYDVREDTVYRAFVYDEDYHSLFTGYKALNELSLGKVKIEAQEKKLYKKIVFIHKDYIGVEVPKSFYQFLQDDLNLQPNTLYTPLYTEVEEVSKNIILPSTKIWMCDSLTFNIISTIPQEWLKRDMLEFYCDQDNVYAHTYLALQHRQFQFFNFLGSMNIRIQTI